MWAKKYFLLKKNCNTENQRKKKINHSGNIFLMENISLTTLPWQGHLLFGRMFLQ